jgi:hypothetical protein
MNLYLTALKPLRKRQYLGNQLFAAALGHSREINIRYMIISAWNGLRLCRLPYGYYFGKALHAEVARRLMSPAKRIVTVQVPHR